MKKIILSCLALLMSSVAWAQVPQQVNLQSLIYDFDGNVTTASSVDLTVRIVDPDLNELYVEDHTGVPVVNGAISINIGSTGTSGEIPLAALDPTTGPKLLDILVDGSTPLGLLPMTAVPYAIYAQKALSVADGSITGVALDPNIQFTTLNVSGDIIVGGTVDGVDISQFATDVTATLADHETRITTLENDTQFSDINGQIAATQIPPPLTPKAWGRFTKGGGLTSSYNVASVSGATVNLGTNLGNTDYIIIGTGRAAVSNLPGATVVVVPFSATISSGSQFTLTYPEIGPIEEASFVVYSN